MTKTIAAPAVRYVVVQYGDSLQRIALRELGDASRWLDLIVLNGLSPPYIVPPELATDRLVSPGDRIMVPAPGSGVAANQDADAVLGCDLLLTKGQLSVANGDLAMVSGIDNFAQALSIRVTVEKRELGFHPEFGCWVRSLLGDIGGQPSARLAAFYVKSALKEDPRVQSVDSCIATLAGDKILVDATVTPVSGQSAALSLVI